AERTGPCGRRWVATVVPGAGAATSSAAPPASASIFGTPCPSPIAGLAGVLAPLVTRIAPEPLSTETISVKVPPVSMPMRSCGCRVAKVKSLSPTIAESGQIRRAYARRVPPGRSAPHPYERHVTPESKKCLSMPHRIFRWLESLCTDFHSLPPCLIFFSLRSPDERSDIRDFPSWVPACRFAHAGYYFFPFPPR